MAFVFLVLLIGAMVGVFRPYKFIPAAKRWHYAVGAIAAFVLIGVMAPPAPVERQSTVASAPSATKRAEGATEPSVQQPKPWLALKEVDDAIAEVDAYAMTKHATVKVDLPEIWSASDMPVRAAMVLDAIGRAVKDGRSGIPPEVETISVWYTGPVLDSYGKEGRSKVFQFTVKTSDLRRMEYDNITPQHLLEFAYDVSFGGPAGRQAAEGYCSDHLDGNPIFCSHLLR